MRLVRVHFALGAPRRDAGFVATRPAKKGGLLLTRRRQYNPKGERRRQGWGEGLGEEWRRFEKTLPVVCHCIGSPGIGNVMLVGIDGGSGGSPPSKIAG